MIRTNYMTNDFITIASVATTIVSYLAMSLVEAVGFEIGLIEKLGGAGLAGLVMYFVITRLLKRNDELTKKVEELFNERLEEAKKNHQERMADQSKHFDEIKTMLKQ